MTRPRIPAELLEAAHARRAARIAGDWVEADRLRASIEAAGWRVSDRGRDFALAPAHPPDVVEDDRIRYGSSGSVPSCQAEASTAAASVILRAADADVGPRLRALREQVASAAQVVVVADAPGPEVAASLERLLAEPSRDALEVTWTSARLGPAACLNIALRRAMGRVLIALGPAAEPRGNLVGPLAAVLESTDVAVAGMGGLAGEDVRRLRPVPPGDVAALDGRCLAVRRDLAALRGPIDERLATWQPLAIWWSLTLRDEGEGRPPLRAVAIGDLPILEHRADAGERPADLARLERRDRYRLLERFGGRPDLFEIGLQV